MRRSNAKTVEELPSAFDLDIRHVAITVPQARLRSLRRYSAAHDRTLERLIRTMGIIVPIVLDEQDIVLCGHRVLAAAKAVGLATVPVVHVAHLSDPQKRVFRLAQHRLAELAKWDNEARADDLYDLLQSDPTFVIDAGYEIDEAELVIDAGLPRRRPKSAETEEVEVPAVQAVTQLGDLWACGDHRLLCGDATNADSYRTLMGASRAAMILSDVPYNVPIAGFVSGNGQAQHREFVQASGEMSVSEFTAFLEGVMMLMARVSRSGSLHYLFIDWRHAHEMLTAGFRVYSELRNIAVWDKGHGGMGSFYRSQHELIIIFKKGQAPSTNNIMLGAKGRDRTNVWSYAGQNSFSATRMADLAAHPTVKPLPLIADALLDASQRGDLILDPFGGSGTTMLAAVETERVARLMELDPLYCDVALRRYAAATGIEPQLVTTGETFSVLEAKRRETAHG